METATTVPGFDRITIEPGKLTGKPCIRGMRISVELVLTLLAGGATPEEILSEYPYLEREDIRQCLAFGAHLAGKVRDTAEVVSA